MSEHQNALGGCFFASVASEVSSRPGPVRNRVGAEQKQWTNLLLENAKQAQRAGHLSADTDPARLTLELSTMLTGTIANRSWMEVAGPPLAESHPL